MSARGVPRIDTGIATGVSSEPALASRDRIRAYPEFVTLARDGSQVGWPLAPELEGDWLVFSTGYVYPAKARNAQKLR